VAVFGKLVQK